MIESLRSNEHTLQAGHLVLRQHFGHWIILIPRLSKTLVLVEGRDSIQAIEQNTFRVLLSEILDLLKLHFFLR